MNSKNRRQQQQQKREEALSSMALLYFYQNPIDCKLMFGAPIVRTRYRLKDVLV